MDPRFIRLFLFLAVAAFGFSILSSPGDRFAVDVILLKRLWFGLLMVASLLAIYVNFRRPPGL